MATYRKKSNKGSWTEGFVMEELKPSDASYKYVEAKVAKTGGTNMKIQKIFTIKNSTTWENYKETRERIFREVGGRVFERRLFHGSSFAKTIAQEGFQKAKSLCGGGIYFSDLASYSDAYAKKNGGVGPFTMLLCRVATGNMGTGRGPAAGSNSFKSGNEIAIHDEKQAYPSFLIEYI